MQLGDIIQAFWRFWKRWNELLLIPVALIVWKLFVWYLPLFFPTAAPPDAGIFGYAVATLVVILIAKGANWLLIKFTWPGMYNYLDNQLEEDLWQLSSRKQRVWVALFFFFSQLLIIALLFKTGF